MLSVAVTNALAVLDSATLKRGPESFSPTLNDIEPAISSAWSSDNKALFLLSAQNIRRHDPATSELEDIYVVEGFGSLSHVLVKDKGTIIFSANDKVHVLDCVSAKISQTFASHKSPITSLSLCNDSSLLASTSTNTVHVHNLVHGSHTVLRGLPLAGQTITTAAFHRHSRTRLLIAIGKQLVVFDTTRPSAPLKTIPVGGGSSGDIIAVACSPFSKTLVAVATSGGNVGLIDLEKEKGLFRTLNLKVPLTALSFSPEGASIYAGTETGKLLILDLRGLDKPPKSITISEKGDRVESISVQSKVKTTSDPKPTPSTTKERVHNSPTKTARAPSLARKPSTASTPIKPTPSTVSKKVFSPAKDPLGNSTSNSSNISLKMHTLNPICATPKKAQSTVKSASNAAKSPSARPSMRENLSGASTSDAKKSPASRPTARTVSTLRKVSSTKSTSPASPGGKSGDSASTAMTSTATRRHPNSSVGSSSSPKVTHRTRTISASSRASKAESISTRSTVRLLPARARTVSSASRTGAEGRNASTTPQGESPIPPVPSLPSSGSNTPSPDLPDIAEPVTPLPQKKGMAVLKLGTPEVEKWIQAGDGEKKKGKGRSVGFLDHRDKEDFAQEPSMEIQVSPRRVTPVRSTSWAPSPLRSPGGASAHDFLRGIVDDVMFEYQKETKAQMTGLHLEMMSMRRGWRKELGEVMEQYVGDLKDLREENKMLRDENERLKRGY